MGQCACAIAPNFTAIGQPIAETWRFLHFQNGGHPPPWICYARVWITHKEYLVVYIVVQNLVGFGAIVLQQFR